ncbi:pyridoxal phosphate-dependent aminotransferase [Sporosarcina sp. BI001-red]|uniref:MalY/PatB family protein n=1 Tax=Sporosarcina sp. BI001-red TaxID=2282866 RepID=UPI000E286651|nr:MalY/PatB family protein [Sporosarcina sp. BI001-red]REB08759.1 pyridoxal phosphate-dependent aminotransferase [Sporosarcina sp. BI001-red]
MIYNFDNVIDRRNTGSVKWDKKDEVFQERDVLPMWVADMDFPSPQPIIEAIKQRADHGIFGYSTMHDGYYDAIIEWNQRRHQWSIEKDWITISPGVVPALNTIVKTFTEPGDKIIIQSPVYYPFTNAIVENGREVVLNRLQLENGRYYMDFEDLRNQLDPSVKMIILCNPHNPGGSVWTKGELQELGEICLAHNILVVSDEIHCDLVYTDYKYTPFASISEAFEQNTICCTAPSKTFNLAGLQLSNIIIPNEDLRQKFLDAVSRTPLQLTNPFAIAATESGYKRGDEWLEQLIAYLQQNVAYLTDYITTHLKAITVIQPESTYLVWLDCRGLGLEPEQLEELLIKKAKVGFNQGYTFGPGGEGFVRVNIACPQSVLKEGLTRMDKAFQELEHTSQSLSGTQNN